MTGCLLYRQMALYSRRNYQHTLSVQTQYLRGHRQLLTRRDIVLDGHSQAEDGSLVDSLHCGPLLATQPKGENYVRRASD